MFERVLQGDYMGNIVDYAGSARESFAEKPFGDVDSLVLAQLSYLNYEHLVPGPGGEFVPFEQLASDEALVSLLKSNRVPALNEKLARGVASSPRFRGLRIGNYVNIIDEKAQEQFSAVTFLLNGEAYVAYRGTDATYVGWKEDFNLAFLSPVPSQVAGAAYLDWVAQRSSGPIRTGGHSKGGNIAVYSSLFCSPETRQRIGAVYSHDGPGFTEGVLESPEFEEMKDRMRKTIPQSSLVGVLLQHQENYRVVRSDEFWILQHDPFSWVVENGDFQYAEGLSSGARFLDESLNAWISSLPREELAAFADALYQVLQALPGSSFADAPARWWDAARETLTGLKDLDADTYVCILHTVGSLLPLVLRNLPKPKPGVALPELHLPDIPAPRVRSLPPPPHPEEFLRQLPFFKNKENKDRS